MAIPDIVVMGIALRLVLSPTYKRFSKPENICDIFFLKRKFYPHNNSVIHPIFSKNPFEYYFVITTQEGESKTWICPFLFTEGHIFRDSDLTVAAKMR